MMPAPGTRLEQYTLKHPQEVLLVRAEIAGEMDEVLIYKGYSSSLIRPTAADPDIPILPPEAEILQIDRLQGPYNPSQPHYLQQGLTWEAFQPLLLQAGL